MPQPFGLSYCVSLTMSLGDGRSSETLENLRYVGRYRTLTNLSPACSRLLEFRVRCQTKKRLHLAGGSHYLICIDVVQRSVRLNVVLQVNLGCRGYTVPRTNDVCY
jgi:hypothetical protein